MWKTKAQVNCKYRAVGCHVIQIGHAICPKAMKKKVTPFAGHIVYLSHPSRTFQWQITTRKLIPTVPAYRGHIPTEPLLCAAIATGYLKIAGWQLVTDRLCCSRAHLVCWAWNKTQCFKRAWHWQSSANRLKSDVFESVKACTFHSYYHGVREVYF